MRRKKVITIYSIGLLLIIFPLIVFFRNIYFSNLSENSLGKPNWVNQPTDTIKTSVFDNSHRLFIQTFEYIYSLDLFTGEVIWQTNFQADPAHITPMVVSRDTLVAQGRNASVGVFNAFSGDLLWSNHHTHGYRIEDWDIFDAKLYIASYLKSFTAYNLLDGEILWSHSLVDRESLYVFADNEAVYLGADDSFNIYNTQQPTQGTLKAEHQLDGLVEYMKKIGNMLYVAYYHDAGISISAVDITTFEKKWNITYRKLPGVSSIKSMYLKNDILYAIGNRIVAISSQNGEILWISDQEISYNKIIFSKDLFYAVDENYLYILEKSTGIETMRTHLPGLPPIFSFIQGKHTNLFIKDNIMVIISNGKIYCYPLSVLTDSK
jgi:outer membrane protein assembly factor BamB